jgi:phenylpropionate dioxygenase-like ring-hydroxylating dioxygenase large terminal subunit
LQVGLVLQKRRHPGESAAGAPVAASLQKSDHRPAETIFSFWEIGDIVRPRRSTRGAIRMAHFTKPTEGSWTQHYGIGTGPVSYEDSISPDHYELERDAIFRKTWLNIGRVEQLPRNGSYLTKELDAARTSIIVVRNGDGELRAFHNICRHRGNKLVWNDFPREEVSGVCRQFTCKYHAWRYSLDGELTFVQQESEFFDLDKADYGLAAVRVEVWEGFIFVNLDNSDTTSLKEYMGGIGAGIEGYPFHKMTQVHKYRAEIGANWKLFIDAFAEFYHAPVLHAKQSVDEESRKLQGYGYEALAYQVDGPHSMVSSWGGMAPPKDLKMVKPIERALRSGLFGTWDAPDIGIDELPEGINPAKHPAWGVDSFVFFPNFMLLVWKPNWYLTYHYWPTAYNTHIFEGTLYFVPPTNAFERLQQELAVVTFKEYALQDANTLEATQTMLESRAVNEFPLNDQEVLLRHLHTTARQYVSDHQQRLPGTPVSVGS